MLCSLCVISFGAWFYYASHANEKRREKTRIHQELTEQIMVDILNLGRMFNKTSSNWQPNRTQNKEPLSIYGGDYYTGEKELKITENDL